jgi:hypothetical protein
MVLRIYRVIRWPLLLMAGIAWGILLGRVLTSPGFIRVDDFVEYWAAGRLTLAGGNPYDPEQVLRLEREAGRPLEEAVMLWNPPWVLALLAPFGALPYPLARSLWFLLQMAALAWGGTQLSRSLRIALARPWGVWALVFTFAPALHALKAGQITPLMLPALVEAMRAFPRHPFRAGLWSALMLVKPHLVYLVLLTLLAESVRQRKPGFALGLFAAAAGASALSGLLHPPVFAQYLHAWRHYPPADWATATLGGFLRLLIGPSYVVLQFLPPLVGLGLWLRYRPSIPEIPLWTLISLATAAYGWTFDLTLALVGLIPAFYHLIPHSPAPRRLGLILAYGILDGVLLFTSMPQVFYFWAGSALLGWALLAQRGAAMPKYPPA